MSQDLDAFRDVPDDPVGEPPLTGPPPARGPNVIVPLVVLAALAGAALYFFLLRHPTTTGLEGVPETTMKVEPPPTGPTVSPLEGIVVPPLDETDSLVRQLVGALSSRPELAAWLATDGLIRNIVTVVDNVADGRSPVRHLKVLAPKGPFATAGPPTRPTIHAATYQRFDGVADTVGSLDPRAVARISATLNPRLQQAYQELGQREGTFDAAVERAIVRLLSAPVIDGDIGVEAHVLSFRYADERLEALSPVEKQLIRMGPRNTRIIQARLRELARALGIPAERLPRPSSP